MIILKRMILEMGREILGWFNVAPDCDHILNVRIPQNAENFAIGCGTSSFSGRALLLVTSLIR